MNNAFTKVLHRKSPTVQGRSGPKVPTHRFFLNLPSRKVMIYYCTKGKKKLGVTDFVLGRTSPEKYPKSEKSDFVS